MKTIKARLAAAERISEMLLGLLSKIVNLFFNLIGLAVAATVLVFIIFCLIWFLKAVIGVFQ